MNAFHNFQSGHEGFSKFHVTIVTLTIEQIFQMNFLESYFISFISYEWHIMHIIY